MIHGIRILAFSFATFLPTALPAQEAKPGSPTRIVVRDRVVELESGKSTHLPGIKSYCPRADRRNDRVFDAGPLNVDLTDDTQLRATDKELRLESIRGKLQWSIALKDLGLAKPPAPQDRALTAQRVLIRTENEVLALDRATGEVKWRREHETPRAWTVRGDLLVTVSGPYNTPTLRVLSSQNGALASKHSLIESIRHLVIGDHGVAACTANQLLVVDRFGPKLFSLQGEHHVAAHPKGWIVLGSDQIALFDPQGKRLWRSEITKPKFLDSHDLHVTTTGNVVLSTHHYMSDSGVFCQSFDGVSGAQKWTRQIAGLGVAHSKYFHHAYARSRNGVIDVVSQGSAGAFVEVLSSDTGASIQRIKP